MVLIVLIVVAVVAAIVGVVIFLSVILKTRNDKKNDWRQLAKDLKGNGDVLAPRDLSNIYVKYHHKLTIPLFLGFPAGKSLLETQPKLPSKYAHLINLLLNSPPYEELNKIKEGETIQMKNEFHPITNKHVKFYYCAKLGNEGKVLRANTGEFILWEGRDLNTDFKVSVFIDFLNGILKDCKRKIVIDKQRVFPSGKDRGFAEYFENIQPLADFSLDSVKFDEKFLSSVAGAVLLRLVLGLKEMDHCQFVVTTKNGSLRLIQKNLAFQKIVISEGSIVTFSNSIINKVKAQDKTKEFIVLIMTGFEHLFAAKNLLYAYGNTLFGSSFVNYFTGKASIFEMDSHSAKTLLNGKLTKLFGIEDGINLFN